jgi:serine/threonine-protein kinase
MSLHIGRQLGSYEIAALLGKGGMDEVHCARPTKLKREVTIILPEEFLRDSVRIIRFKRQAEVPPSLNHLNIDDYRASTGDPLED